MSQVKLYMMVSGITVEDNKFYTDDGEWEAIRDKEK